MKKHITTFMQNPLVMGSSFIFSGTLFGNVFNFLFQAYMLRALSKADYGTLGAILSLITLPSLAATAIAPAIVNFAGGYFANNELSKVQSIFRKAGKFYFVISLTIFIAFLLFIPTISSFFHIKNYMLLVIADILIFISFFHVLNTSLLQAKLSFRFISFITIITAIVKFAVGLLFVTFGMGINGAMYSIAIATIFPFFLTYIPLRFLFQQSTEKVTIDTKTVFLYGLPSAVATLGLTSFITSDILLVKHYFSPDDAGFYNGISTIAKIIFYFSSPISTVMFPLIIQKRSMNESYTAIVMMSILLVAIPAISINIFYFLFPTFVLAIFGIQDISPYPEQSLAMFGVFITLYALVSVLVNFYLSINKTKIWIPIILCALLQIILITIYHATFITIVQISITVTFLLFVFLLLYYPHATKEK